MPRAACILFNLPATPNRAAQFPETMRSGILFLGFTAAACWMAACTGTGKQSGTEGADSISADEKLARQYCGSCHLYPEPELLDRNTWLRGVLPVMGPKMGIYEHRGEVYTMHERGDTPLLRTKIYPDKPMLSSADWQRILDFYGSRAPETRPQQVRNMGIGGNKGLFSPQLPERSSQGPMAVFTKIDPARKLIFFGDGNDNTLHTYDASLKKLSSLKLSGSPAWIDEPAAGQLQVTTLGSIFPSSKREGGLLSLRIDGAGKLSGGNALMENLQRPTQVQEADFDGDGRKDKVVNAFGHLEGELYWLPGGDMAKKKVLRAEPGAIHTKIVDHNGDGKPDLMTMFCQGREGIYLSENQGNGEFREKRLLEFLPVNGSSGFDWVDMNGDGHKDIVYTSGDNADYSIVLKHFHGVTVYLNDGKGAYTQQWFYPINGCYKALCRDFDLDGDMDILTLSFFADYAEQPNEILVYFENQGNMQFLPTQVDGYQNGRWLTADAGDVDGDGDEDIVLGNFSQGPGQVPREAIGHWVNSPGFMLLRNNAR
jgi:hypothetical protein